jgi:hypothetical protein
MVPSMGRFFYESSQTSLSISLTFSQFNFISVGQIKSFTKESHINTTINIANAGIDIKTGTFVGHQRNFTLKGCQFDPGGTHLSVYVPPTENPTSASTPATNTATSFKRTTYHHRTRGESRRWA